MSRRANARSSLLLLCNKISVSLTSSLDLVTLIMPKQTKSEDDKASSSRMLVGLLASTALSLAHKEGPTEYALSIMRFLFVLSDSASWHFHSKVGLSVVRETLAKIAIEFLSLENLPLSPNYIYLQLYKSKTSSTDLNAVEISEISLALLLRSAQHEIGKGTQFRDFALGAQVLADLLSSGVVFEGSSGQALQRLREQGSSLLQIVLPCINSSAFRRKDGFDEAREEVNEDGDPMGLDLEPQLFILANLVDLVRTAGTQLRDEVRVQTFKAISVVRSSTSEFGPGALAEFPCSACP